MPRELVFILVRFFESLKLATFLDVKSRVSFLSLYNPVSILQPKWSCARNTWSCYPQMSIFSVASHRQCCVVLEWDTLPSASFSQLVKFSPTLGTPNRMLSPPSSGPSVFCMNCTPVASASFRQKDFPWPYCLARAVTGSLSLYHVSMFSTSFHVRWRMLSAVLGNVASSLSSHCPSCQDGRVATAGRRSWPRETAALCLLRVIQKRQTSIRDTEECRWGEKKKAEFTTTLPANICVEL